VRLRRELIILFSKTFEVTLDGRKSERFLSLKMIWLKNNPIRGYVLSHRIAKISAELLGTKSVRLYHDNALSKEPGSG